MIAKDAAERADHTVVSRVSALHAPLPPALPGERLEFDSAAGRLSAYVCGQGAPMLLIHSINAVGSAAEVRPLYEHYRSSRRVIALDLPGFGFSERSDRAYTPRLMTDAVLAAVAQIQARFGRRAVDALALSLSAEFLARAAVEYPLGFRTVSFVSPTGLGRGKPRRGAPGTTLGKPWLYRVLRGPGWGRTLYRGLTKPRVIRYFLRRTWGSAAIDEPLWQYDVLTARQPGAEFAPLCFLSGGLFSDDIDTLYEQLTMPVWMSHGVRGDFTDYGQIAIVKGRPNWHFSVFATGALPHFEVLPRFCAAYDTLLH